MILGEALVLMFLWVGLTPPEFYVIAFFTYARIEWMRANESL